LPEGMAGHGGRVQAGDGYLITRVGGAAICQKLLDDGHLALNGSSQESLWLHGTLLVAGQAEGWGIAGARERGQYGGPPALIPRGGPQLARVTQGLVRGGSSPCPSSPHPSSQAPPTYNHEGLRWRGWLRGGCPLLPALPALLAELDEALDAPHVDDLPPQVHRALPHPLLALGGTRSTLFAFSVPRRPSDPPPHPDPLTLTASRPRFLGPQRFSSSRSGVLIRSTAGGSRMPSPLSRCGGVGGCTVPARHRAAPPPLSPSPPVEMALGTAHSSLQRSTGCPANPWACACPPTLLGELGTCPLLRSVPWVGAPGLGTRCPSEPLATLGWQGRCQPPHTRVPKDGLSARWVPAQADPPAYRRTSSSSSSASFCSMSSLARCTSSSMSACGVQPRAGCGLSSPAQAVSARHWLPVLPLAPGCGALCRWPLCPAAQGH